MFNKERLDEILNILDNEGKVKVKDLSKKFSVTEDCIRKDLKQLEQMDKLQRTYGGAIKLRKSKQNYEFSDRKKIDISKKSIIAKKAVDIIEDRDTIFLDLSTTNILIAKLLASSKKRVTVVTNMLDIINILSSEDNNITVIATSGILNKNLLGFIGPVTIDLIRRYKFDKSFIGSCGIDVFDKSITTFDIEDGITKTAIIESSKKTFLVMESQKFYTDGNYKFATVADVQGIITDAIPNDEIINILNEDNIELY